MAGNLWWYLSAILKIAQWILGHDSRQNSSYLLTEGAFHSTKNSGLKFRNFRWFNGTGQTENHVTGTNTGIPVRQYICFVHVKFAAWKTRPETNHEWNTKISRFPEFPEKRTSSKRIPKFPKKKSETFPFHWTSDRNFRNFLSNGKRPESHSLNLNVTITFATGNPVVSVARTRFVIIGCRYANLIGSCPPESQANAKQSKTLFTNWKKTLKLDNCSTCFYIVWALLGNLGFRSNAHAPSNRLRPEPPTIQRREALGMRLGRIRFDV